MTMRVVECEQRSPEWYAARMGIPTASEFATVMAQGRTKGSESKTRRTYMLKLAGEIVTGEPAESYDSAVLERGRLMEDPARRMYAFQEDADPVLVGFLRDDARRAGASPDALLGDDGILEIKTAAPHILIAYLGQDDFPAEHKAQCQGNLWISGREWIDIAIYWPKLPLFVKRARRDEGYIRKIAAEVARFNDELDEVVDMVRRYGERPATAREAFRRSLETA